MRRQEAYSTEPYPATTIKLKSESTGGNSFSISSRYVTSFPACFCVLLQRPCVHYTELFIGFVGRSLTKPAQIVDIFLSAGIFHICSFLCGQRQVSFPLPFGFFLPAHDCHLTCPILTFYYSYFLPCVLWANEI